MDGGQNVRFYFRQDQNQCELDVFLLLDFNTVAVCCILENWLADDFLSTVPAPAIWARFGKRYCRPMAMKFTARLIFIDYKETET